jgi:hypothetical protein
MTDQSYHVYVIQGRGQRDYSDCQAARPHVSWSSRIALT